MCLRDKYGPAVLFIKLVQCGLNQWEGLIIFDQSFEMS
jgi:hypothetical protein